VMSLLPNCKLDPPSLAEEGESDPWLLPDGGDCTPGSEEEDLGTIVIQAELQTKMQTSRKTETDLIRDGIFVIKKTPTAGGFIPASIQGILPEKCRTVNGW
jgi:hypothetical protein